MSVRTKSESLAAWQRGELGPKLASWETLAALEGSGYAGAVAIRYTAPGSRFFQHGIPTRDVRGRVAELLDRGARPEALRFSACAPDELLTLQGEVMRSIRHLTLFYSHEKTPMRFALRERGQQVEGMAAWLLLQEHLTPSSREDLDALWERYPDAVIEFSAYRATLPGFPGRNTLIWEVREGY